VTTNVRVVARGRNLRRAAAVEARAMASTPPWQRPRPPGPRAALTPAQRAWAEAAALRHGRRYPNLVDNIAARRQPPDVDIDAPPAAVSATRRRPG